jgi:hypothetical protein
VSESTPASPASGQPQAIHPPSFQRGEIGDAKLSAALRTLELTVKRKLDGVLHGNHLGLLPGPGSEPGDSRPYQPGDDVRRMDWSVTARTTHPHVRQMIADRELETWLVVDDAVQVPEQGAHDLLGQCGCALSQCGQGKRSNGPIRAGAYGEAEHAARLMSVAMALQSGRYSLDIMRIASALSQQ